MELINKILGVLNVIIIVLFTIPDLVEMIGWLNSGVMKSCFYLLTPINFLIILLGIVLLIVRNKGKKKLLFLILNAITFILSCYWAYYLNMPATA